MKSKVIKILNLIVAALVCAFAIGYAFAWLSESRKSDDAKFNGSSGQTYFAGGNGTEEQPYIINDKYHMYNLAWLQDTGKLNEKKYYFELDSNLTIPADFWLPPIGTDAYPFIGDFNGNGNTISGLKITTDKSKLKKVGVPSGSGDFSNAVGMFGMTGAGSEIHNFILDYPIVEAATDNATYSAAAKRTAGIAIGMVSGKAYSIGVKALEPAVTAGAQLLMNRSGYSTFNSIIGAIADGSKTSVTGGGYNGTGGSGSAFGASFDVVEMLDRLNKIKANNGASPYLPTIDTSSDNPVVGGGDKMPFAVTDASKYDGADAKEVTASNNVGYFLGNQNKISTTKEYQFTDPLIDPGVASVDWYSVVDGENQSPADSGRVPKWIYKFDGGYSLSGDVYTSQMGFAPLSQSEFEALPEVIQGIFPEDNNTKKRFTGVKLSQAWWITEEQTVQPVMSTGEDNGNWSYHGQIVWNGKTYGKGFRDHNGNAVDENWQPITYVDDYGQTLQYKSSAYPEGVILPNCTIWFKPVQTGKIKLLMFADGGLEGFALLKIVREGADSTNPFKVNAVLNDSWQWETDIYVSQVMRVRLPKNVLFYYEHEVTSEDIANGNVEYMLVSENNGAYFVYMDLGASAAEDTDTSTIDPDAEVSAIDFIYQGVSIAQTADTDNKIAVGDFIVTASGTAYEATKTSIYFENLNTILQIVFVRPENGKTAEGTTLAVTVTPAEGVGEIKQTKGTAVIQ